MFKIYFRLRKRKRIRRRSPSAKKYKLYKEAARQLAHERLGYFNRHYKFKIGKVAIRNQKSRWGSCSTKGNLNFNYKISLIPQYLSDYVIVHELCHLGQFNHSQKFWDLVAETLPDWPKLRAELKKIRI